MTTKSCALLMRANKPKTAVQSSIFFSLGITWCFLHVTNRWRHNYYNTWTVVFGKISMFHRMSWRDLTHIYRDRPQCAWQNAAPVHAWTRRATINYCGVYTNKKKEGNKRGGRRKRDRCIRITCLLADTMRETIISSPSAYCRRWTSAVGFEWSHRLFSEAVQSHLVPWNWTHTRTHAHKLCG